jgi:hypothetical protein
MVEYKNDQTERENMTNIPHCHFPSIYPVQNLLGALERLLGTYKKGWLDHINTEN